MSIMTKRRLNEEALEGTVEDEFGLEAIEKMTESIQAEYAQAMEREERRDGVVGSRAASLDSTTGKGTGIGNVQ
jgi:hypothetical protein